MSDDKLYVVTAGETYYPLSADGDWRGVFRTEQNALDWAKGLQDDWVAVMEIDIPTLEHRVLRQRQS